jgi:hypothetical protein
MHLLIVGGSDAGIAAGLRAREVDPTVRVTIVMADLSYTPPLGSPWDAVQHAGQAWEREWATSRVLA